jgi:hypothetical protein
MISTRPAWSTDLPAIRGRMLACDGETVNEPERHPVGRLGFSGMPGRRPEAGLGNYKERGRRPGWYL